MANRIAATHRQRVQARSRLACPEPARMPAGDPPHEHSAPFGIVGRTAVRERGRPVRHGWAV